MPGEMDALATACEIARNVSAPAARRNDAEARFPRESVEELGKRGLLGLMLPVDAGGLGVGPRAFADVTAALSEADASLGMVFVMHTAGVACIAAAPASPRRDALLRDVAAGGHLTTLAFSERGSRSHFWAPVSRASRNGAGAYLSAEKSWVTSAGEADSYVVTTQAPDDPTKTTLYLVPRGAAGLRVEGRFDGLGLRANASAPMRLDRVHVPDELRLTPEGGGMDAKLSVVLPLFSLGAAAVSLGIARAAVAATAEHLRQARFEHLGHSLAEGVPGLRARLAVMHIETQGVAQRVAALAASLEAPGPETMLRVLETKAAANEAALRVTGEAMRACGGAAFSQHTSLDRHFRDAQAGPVMAPTVEQLHEFLGRALLGLPVFG